MKLKLICIIFAVFACLAPPSRAQSTRPPTPQTEKKNQRPAAPQPTPTPVPVSDGTPSPDSVASTDDGEVIKVDTQLVSVPVRVMDKKGRFVGGLIRENFKVYEDGVEQDVALFSNEHEPFTVALVLDMSYSTTFKIAEIQNAAITFIDQLRPQDKVMVVSFDEEVHILCDPTNDRNTIYAAIKSTRIATGTSLYEAVDQVINHALRAIVGRKAVILFTDGVDTTSRKSTAAKNLNDAMELDSLVYTIRYDTFADVQKMKNGQGSTAPPPISAPIPKNDGNPFPFPITSIGKPSSQGTTPEEYQRAEEYLDQMAERTGGRTYLASTLTNLSDAFSRIASELREFYSIAYYPKEDHSKGKQKNVKVKVSEPGLVVRSREGYLTRQRSK